MIGPYLQFFNSDERPTQIVYIDPAHYVAAGNEEVIPFVEENGDRVHTHYKRVGYAAVYDPPATPTPDPVADIDGFINDIWTDQNLTAVRMNLIMWKPLIVEYLALGETGIARIQEAWVQIKAGFDQINTGLAPIIEGYATQRNVPLTS